MAAAGSADAGAYDAGVQAGDPAASEADRAYLVARHRDLTAAVAKVTESLEGWKTSLKALKDELAAVRRAAKAAGVDAAEDGEG